MATIQVVIDEELLSRLDCELEGVQRKRSAFVRRAIERELRLAEKARLDEQDRLGYLEPQTQEEQEDAEAWLRLGAEVWRNERWDRQPRELR